MAHSASERRELTPCPEAGDQDRPPACVSVHREGMRLAGGCTAIGAQAGTPAAHLQIPTSQLPPRQALGTRKAALLPRDPASPPALPPALSPPSPVSRPREVPPTRHMPGRQRSSVQDAAAVGARVSRGGHPTGGSGQPTWPGRPRLLPRDGTAFWNMPLPVVLAGASRPPLATSCN